jgi:predicted phosphoribosyltransferase
MFLDSGDIVFENREEAGRQLADRLEHLRPKKPVVLALPRGGVPVAHAVATALGAPLDVILVRKIGVPTQPELALGAVVDGARAQSFVNQGLMRDLGISEDYLQTETETQLAEIERRRKLYVGDRPYLDVAGRCVIVVDDGIATGATMQAALRALRQAKAGRIVLAVPVAPPDSLETLREEVDEVVCLATPEWFGAIGRFYADFHQLEDDEVVALLADAAAPDPKGRSPGSSDS